MFGLVDDRQLVALSFEVIRALVGLCLLALVLDWLELEPTVSEGHAHVFAFAFGFCRSI